MQARIIKQAILEGLPTASGMEIIDGMIYIVSKDATFLFCLDPYLQVKQKIKLLESTGQEVFQTQGKSDLGFGAITSIKINGFNHLVIFGSGLLPSQNDKAFLVKLPTPYNRNFLVWERNMQEFYDFLSLNEEIVEPGSSLQIEGVAKGRDFLVLFNRKRKSAFNTALYFYLEEFIEFIQAHTEGFPFPLVLQEPLPLVEKKPVGFTGVTLFDEKLFFTITAEVVSDTCEEEMVMKSYLGWGKVNSFDRLRGMEQIPMQQGLEALTQITKDEEIYKRAILAVSLFEKTEEEKYIALTLVNDDAKGYLELLMLEVTL